jgi:hypothetical protein
MKVAFTSGPEQASGPSGPGRPIHSVGEPGAGIVQLGDKTPLAPPPSVTIVRPRGPGLSPGPGPLVRVVGGLAILLVSALVGAALFGPPDDATAVTARGPAPRSVTLPPAPPRNMPNDTVAQPARDTVSLSVSVSPAHAQVVIDGTVMPAGPVSARFARDTNLHRIQVRAPGFQTKERLVTFADNVIVDLGLSPRRSGPALTPRRRLERAVASPPGLPPAARSPLHRRIESRNPYAEDTLFVSPSRTGSVSDRTAGR